MRSPIAKGPVLHGLCVLAYTALAHVAASRHSAELAVFAVGLLVLIPVVPSLVRREPRSIAIVALGGLALAMSDAPRWMPLILYLPPILINAGLAWLFGHTLVRGEIPLVARIVDLLHTEDDIRDPSVWKYARSVTVCWTVLFCINGSLCLLLALVVERIGLLALLGLTPPLTVPVAYWSAFANVGCYALAAVLFVVEYAYRRHRFPWQPYRSFFHFISRAASVGPVIARQLRSKHEQRQRG